MSINNARKDYIDIFNEFMKDGQFSKVGKILGKGAFGEVRDIVYKNKQMAGKVLQSDKYENSGESYAYDLRGQNIIKVNKIISKEVKNENYYLIIMEKAILRDLGKLSDYYHNHNLLKLIYNPFNEMAGDSLVRFYTKQIITALEILNRGNYVHFDLKPENLLITISLIVKLSDFGLLKKVEDNDSLKIPGGTSGYVTLEYYKRGEKVSGEVARKQDYFALGATIFYLKYGRQMIKYKKNDNDDNSVLAILSGLDKEISKIRSETFTDQDFIDLLVKLTGYKPEDRPNFEEIYRNKWLNKDLDRIHEIFWGFEFDEEKLIMELQKNDYLIKKEDKINKKPSRFRFKKNKNDK